MSSCTPSPPSLQSEDSRDSTSSEFSSTIGQQYNTTLEIDQKNVYKVNTLTSHGVEDILSEGITYAQENVFPDCKSETLNAISNTFSQDYNSRDSTGFSIHDILGLHQSYNPTNVPEEVENRYDYQIPNYENVSNSSHNNYGSGTEDITSDECMNKSDSLFATPNVHLDNQVSYDRNYLSNEPERCHRSDLDNDVVKETVRDANDLHLSSFPNQVNILLEYLIP